MTKLPEMFSVAGVNASEEQRTNLIRCFQEATNGDSIFVDIIPEPTNPYDSNALRVEINKRKVGFIAKKDQTRYHGVAKGACRIMDWGVWQGDKVYCKILVAPPGENTEHST